MNQTNTMLQFFPLLNKMKYEIFRHTYLIFHVRNFNLSEYSGNTGRDVYTHNSHMHIHEYRFTKIF